MLKLSVMGMGDHRGDVSGATPLAASASARWRHDAGSLNVFRYSSNFIFDFRDQGQRRFLRSAHESQRSRSQIEIELSLMLWLAGEGIRLASPVPSRQGQLIESIETDCGTFHAVVFDELAGDLCEIDDLDLDAYRSWGAALGRLHAATRRYPGAQAATRPSWRDDLAVIAQHLPAHEPAIARELDHLAGALSNLPIDPDAFGLIHYDFELDNIIWNDGIPGIVDFDDCAHHWYAADVAFALRDLFDHGVAAADPRVQSFLAGYADFQPIDDDVLAYLPLFSRLRRLITYGRVARALDLQPNHDYPVWLRELEARLANRLVNYQASLRASSVIA
jgi:Ser/Thr protein kinase RdoA (MazF antagonist)